MMDSKPSSEDSGPAGQDPQSVAKAERSRVEWVGKDTVEIRCNDPTIRQHLRQLGARPKFLSRREWVLRYASEQELAAHFGRLRDFGLAFVGGPAGWPPAAIFRDLRDKKLLTGGFTEIVWMLNPPRPVIFEK